MKFTSEDLMKAMGLQVGDRIRINDKPDNYFVELNECGIPCVKDEYTKNRFEMKYLIDRKIEILPRPKRVGDLKCGECGCNSCPIRAICVDDLTDDTLYNKLELAHKYAKDQEIYDLLKARLDKEVLENE